MLPIMQQTSVQLQYPAQVERRNTLSNKSKSKKKKAKKKTVIPEKVEK